MNYILFENNYDLLRPFSDLHASFELRAGVFNNIERLMESISSNDSVQLYVREDIKDLIKERYPKLSVNPDYFDPGIYLNGSCIWSSELLESIDHNRSYSNQNGLIAFHTDLKILIEDISDAIKDQSKVSTRLENVVSIKYLWDIFGILGETINSDFELLHTNKQGDIHPSCIFINDDTIIINDNVKISAGVILDASEGPIVIDSNSFIDIGSLIKGPVYIGNSTKLNPGTKLIGPVVTGPLCKLGGEIEDSVIQGFSNKQHDGFLGHSYIGEWVNLGASTNTSDLKNNYSTIRMQINDKNLIDTEEMFIGSLIGDFSRTAIGTKLNTGTFIGVGSNLFEDGFQNKYIPSFSWGQSEKVGLNRFINSSKKAMSRRDCIMSETLKQKIIQLYQR